MVYDDHTELTPLDAAELAAVLGGFSWQAVLQGALQGALGGASQGGQGGVADGGDVLVDHRRIDRGTGPLGPHRDRKSVV